MLRQSGRGCDDRQRSAWVDPVAGSGQQVNVGSELVGERLEGRGVDVLDIAETVDVHRHAACGAALRRPPAVMRRSRQAGEGLGRRAFDQCEGVADATHRRQRLQPSDERDRHDDDEADRQDEQHEAAARVEHAEREPDEAEHREEKGANEGGDRVLRSAILGQQRPCPWRCRSGRGLKGLDHGAEREDRDREQAGGEDREQTFQRIRREHREVSLRHAPAQDRAEHERGHRRQRIDGRP